MSKRIINHVEKFDDSFIKEVKRIFPSCNVQECIGFPDRYVVTGFHIEFRTGFKASVQFGPYNYCNNRGSVFSYILADCREYYMNTANTAEIAAWHIDPTGKSGDFIDFGWGDQVLGHQTPNEVILWLLANV